MYNEEQLIKLLSDTASKLKLNFNYSIDATFNNCLEECRRNISQTNSESYWILNSISNYLKRDIVEYTIYCFSEESLSKLLKRIETDNEKEFDEKFIAYMEDNEKNNTWVNSVEKRLYDLLLEKKRINL
ncbi:MAG: hypothetical protein PUJ82_16805 [Spirochaetales bacterium]|nr:hypothetical protein [Treponema sp.]MDD7612565.1 hypothetical protein [Spirochaetales bacterium]MDY5916668.1 hypothetical protein [Treponema sp.]